MPSLFIRSSIFPELLLFFNKDIATRHCEAKIIICEAKKVMPIQCWWKGTQKIASDKICLWVL